VTYETKRRGAPKPQQLTWTLADAQRAGLGGGDNWKKYPRAMLSARCKAELARDVYPDVLAGVYETSEADEIAGTAQVLRAVPPQTPPGDVVDAEVVSETKHGAPTFDVDKALSAIQSAADLEVLRAEGAKLVDAPAGAKPRLKAAYSERREWLRKHPPAPPPVPETTTDDNGDAAIAARDAE
jgi:hypothetical protein